LSGRGGSRRGVPGRKGRWNQDPQEIINERHRKVEDRPQKKKGKEMRTHGTSRGLQEKARTAALYPAGKAYDRRGKGGEGHT